MLTQTEATAFAASVFEDAGVSIMRRSYDRMLALVFGLALFLTGEDWTRLAALIRRTGASGGG